jgi:L-fuculose-phosphate aldolase
MNKVNELREEVAYFMRRLYTQGLTTTSGGNISAMNDDGTVLITPSASDKGRMTGAEIGRMDINGKIIGDPFKPSIESQMHLQIYKKRPDVKAVVHAHPVNASAFAATTIQINNRYMAESYAILGDIAYCNYFLMGSRELAQAVGESVENSNCIVMRNHGVLAVGRTLLEAFDRLEVLEAAARITLINISTLKDGAVELAGKDLDDIDVMMGR